MSPRFQLIAQRLGISPEEALDQYKHGGSDSAVMRELFKLKAEGLLPVSSPPDYEVRRVIWRRTWLPHSQN